MSIEHELPQLSWLAKLESAVGVSQILEIEGDTTSIIVSRVDKSKHPTA